MLHDITSPSFSEMQSALTKENDFNNKVNLVILRNITIEPIEVPLRYFGGKFGLNIHCDFGSFDNAIQDTLGSSDLINENTNLVIIILPLIAFSSKLYDSYSSLSPKTINEESNFIIQTINSLMVGIRKKSSNAKILFHSFEKLPYPMMGIADNELPLGQNKTINELNSNISTIISNTSNAWLIDTNTVMARIGYDNYYDWRLWYLGRALYSRKTLQHFSHLHLDYLKSFMGLTKKCLILDCDQTLWKGVVGEDGFQGICMDSSPAGLPFQSFQKFILTLNDRGVILALSSKNNEEDVWKVFEENSNMLIKKEHIAAHRINWKNKPEQIQEIAKELNIHLDSIVFVDDNPFEIEMVHSAIPDVTCILLPENSPSSYTQILQQSGLFDQLNFTDEDRNKNKLYKAQKKRDDLKSVMNLSDYLTSLKMQVSVIHATELNIPRVSQLTLKTNQFNLTTKRYTEDEIQKMLNSRDYLVWTLALSDRFSDMGIVGIAIINKTDENIFKLNTFLLSCRALGREVERAFISIILANLSKINASKLVAEYIPSSKNALISNFLEDIDFTINDALTVAPNKVYMFSFSNQKPLPVPSFINIK